jgi:hypothetical protein
MESDLMRSFKIYYRNIMANHTTFQWVRAKDSIQARAVWEAAVSSNQEFIRCE